MQTVPDTLTSERLAIFIDLHKTRQALRRAGQQIDLLALRDYLREGRNLVETFAYVATDPEPERHAIDLTRQQRLRQHGFLIRTRTGQRLANGSLACNFDVELALDVQDFVARTRPDIVVLVTDSGDLTPLAHRLRMRGTRVEVAAAPADIADVLRARANGFIDLTQISAAVDNLSLPHQDFEGTFVPTTPSPVPSGSTRPVVAGASN